MAERTAKDYAIEHAEYMAKAAEVYMEAEANYAALVIDNDALCDARRALRMCVYEFRKRAERASRENER